MLPTASVIHGDASNLALLESEGLSGCDALVALTGLDELNIFISLYGNSCGVPQIITKLGRMDNLDILSNLPIGSIISPRELCCDSIVRYVRAMRNQTGAAISMHTIADGQAEAIEFLVDETTRHCGEPLKKIKLRRNVLIASISRNTKTEIPSGESSFNVGDTLIVVTSGDTVIYQLNDIFE
jgi:trk system potassium uptake protein TrkA